MNKKRNAEHWERYHEPDAQPPAWAMRVALAVLREVDMNYATEPVADIIARESPVGELAGALRGYTDGSWCYCWACDEHGGGECNLKDAARAALAKLD
jgi:hypothetical protein